MTRDDLASRYGAKAVQGLDDLLAYAQDAAEIVDQGRPRFQADRLLRLAAEAVLIHLGEAAGRVGPELAADHPGLGLKGAVATRHVLAHGCDIVDHAVVWTTMVDDVPRLAAAVAALVAE